MVASHVLFVKSGAPICGRNSDRKSPNMGDSVFRFDNLHIQAVISGRFRRESKGASIRGGWNERLEDGVWRTEKPGVELSK